METVLKRAYEDFAAVVSRHLGLFDQRDGCHQGLDGAAIVSWGGEGVSHLTPGVSWNTTGCIFVYVFVNSNKDEEV